MLPLQQAFEVRTALEEYLKATFSFKDQEVHDAFYNFINDPEDGIFKGPYVSLKLPFLSAPADSTIPLEIKPSFPPYRHQYEAFCRLSTQGGNEPKPTLITTGTSSGKTESFLFPLLDYCHQHQERPGIKAIILYPMNALATDQAMRLAELIWSDDRLKGKITAGLFIGEGERKGGGKSYPTAMGPKNIIEHRGHIISSPPDILLTNFKMLDYGLMKGLYDTLWQYNYADPSLLRFLVLDELHTYDGAQGTDVANLIRRIKLKLNIGQGQLCPVGTSATMGNSDEALDRLVEYASRVFGEPVGRDAVLQETRLSLDDFMPLPAGGYIPSWPHPSIISRARIGAHESYEEYLHRQKKLWQLDFCQTSFELGQELRKLQIIRDILEITAEGTIHLDDLKKRLAQRNASFSALPEWDNVQQYHPRDQVLQSLLALLAAAQTRSGSKEFPMLYMQIQLWVRELSGVLRKTTQSPAFTWKSSGNNDKAFALPAYHCRECGSCGWLGVRHDNRPDQIETDIRDVYQHYFENHKNLWFLNTDDHDMIEEYRPTDTLDRYRYLQPDTLHLFDRAGNDCLPIVGYRVLQAGNNNRARHICPECNTEDSISIIGTRVATLSSITVSQVLSSDLDPRPDQERKILAFTNSVQDAAHQAGFTEARNYRFTFRASLQRVLQELKDPVSLPDLQERFLEYWKEHSDPHGNKQIEAYIYRFFPADYRGKVNLRHDYRDPYTKKFKDGMIHQLDLRLSWEIVSEYGLNAQLGRTLEKTGASAIHFDYDKIQLLFPALHNWLSENQLGMITASELEAYVHGILQRLRQKGAIDHPHLEKYRASGLRLWDLNWSRDSRHYLNRTYGPRTRKPKVLITNPRPPEGAESTYGQAMNWYLAYFKKGFPLAPAGNFQLINEFHQQLATEMTNMGLLDSLTIDEATNYVINPASIFASTEVAIWQCSHCNSLLQTTEQNPLADKTPCLDYRCSGTYSEKQNNQFNYYQQVYNRRRSPRIYASEHTGLLPRQFREEVEHDFKERPAFNSLNALVATSTLEMGINIGTLNAVINNSIPKATANFLQRVGRAGRASGSALVTNFAESQNHDLFHYAEPIGMMEGEVSAPGCFLEAKEILRRHFFAFCIDCWAKDDPRENNFPNRISSLKLASADLNDPRFIINRLLGFVHQHESSLLTRFRMIYQHDALPDEVFDQLNNRVRSGRWYDEIKEVFAHLKVEILDLLEKQQDIKKVIADRGLGSTDPEYIELQAEIRSLNGIRRTLEKRSPVEHLTNRGLLPNYAFPETGVKLQATVRAYTAKGSDAAPVHEEFEIVRDAATALRELAPANDFYGLGFKFHISGINTYDWKEPGVLLQKRFCSNCDHLENDMIPVQPTCPKCGDASWAADSNRHPFVQLTAVKSSNKREDATLDDSSEERKDVYYRQTRHLRFDPDSSCGGIGLKDIPFGIEYVKHVTCTEVNLGESGAVHANQIRINQTDGVPRHGFITCRYCGKSSVWANKAIADEGHYAYCKHKDKSYTGDSNDPYFTEVFLFREMETEALKILLPVQDFETEEVIELFKAGIEAGLRLYYQGNPGHIALWEYREYNTNTQRFDRYLVLFDKIPGGTGYLEKLFNREQFSKLINKAYEHLKNCSCQHHGKKGCYRCIYTYQNQRVHDSLDRGRAEALFAKIAGRISDWEEYKEGLGTLAGTGQIEESELEDRFIRSLKNITRIKEPEGWSWSEQRSGSVHYFLTVAEGGTAYTWQIEPQVNLGVSQGIAFATRADFLATLVAVKENGAERESTDCDRAPRWAIYMDGYAFHAQGKNLRFFSDVARRRSIANTGQYRSWTLTWEDLDLFDANLANKAVRRKDRFAPDPQMYGPTIAQLKGKAFEKFQSKLPEAEDSLCRWLWFLAHPFPEQKPDGCRSLLLAMMQRRLMKPSFNGSDLRLFLSGHVNENHQATDQKDFLIVSEAGRHYSFTQVRVAVHLPRMDTIGAITLTETTNTLPKDAWNDFWRLYNLVQDALIDDRGAADAFPADAAEDLEFLKYYDYHLHDIVRALHNAGIDVSREGSFFLEDPEFEPAEAAIGSKTKKFFIAPISADDRALFLQAGYSEITPENFDLEQWK